MGEKIQVYTQKFEISSSPSTFSQLFGIFEIAFCTFTSIGVYFSIYMSLD
jgi:hypothetical protein